MNGNECSTMECHRPVFAVTSTGRGKCIQCILKVMNQYGPDGIKTVENAVLPWEEPIKHECGACGFRFTQGMMELGGHCPKCRHTVVERKHGKLK